MFERQDVHGVLGPVIPVQGHVARVTELDHEFTQHLGGLRQRPAYVGGVLQQLELLGDGLAGPPGRVRRLVSPTAV